MSQPLFSAILFVSAVGLTALHCGRTDTPSSDNTTESITKAANDDTLTERPFGEIAGRVLYSDEAPRPQKLLVVKDVAVCGQRDHFDERLIVGDDRGLKNVVVSVTGIPSGAQPAFRDGEYVLHQSQCRYEPYMQLLPVNTPLQILNHDGILHNIHTYSEHNPPVNLAQPAFKKKIDMIFTAPEQITFRCDVHGWMSAWVVVVDHPFHAITNEAGHFVIQNLPPGSYTLKFWHELLGERNLDFKVQANKVTTLDFTFGPKS